MVASNTIVSMMIKMKRYRTIFFLLIIILLASCREAPVTERKQLILIPESSEKKLGEDTFRKIIMESTLSKNLALLEKVKKVGVKHCLFLIRKRD
jgi:hypothetical protein